MRQLPLVGRVPGLLVLAALSCREPERDEDREARQFFAQHIATHGPALRALPVERQVEIYEYGLRHRKPPAQYLSYHLAQGGAAVIDPILRRLRRESSEMLVSSYVSVLEDMACYHGMRPLEDSTTDAVVQAAIVRTWAPTDSGGLRALRRLRGDCTPSRTLIR